MVRAVVAAPAGASSGRLPYLDGHAYFDPFGIARAAFGVGTPAAVLLGTDGMLAGGPVQGEEDVARFVAEVADQPAQAGRRGGGRGQRRPVSSQASSPASSSP